MGDEGHAMTTEENNHRHNELIRKICLYEIRMAHAISAARKPGETYEHTPMGETMMITCAPGGARQRVHEQYPYE
jgi:hypothetical protein